jgi:CubicO group peptidase (beta-lactamase class C family)
MNTGVPASRFPTIAAVLTLLVAAQSLPAQELGTPQNQVDQIMAPYSSPESPGAVVAVVRDGEIVFQRAYGMANLTHQVPFAVDTRGNLASTAKQFTAFAFALLTEQGRLGLDDDMRVHIPELPDLGETVTLRHLLTHTSGYREFLNALAIGGWRIEEPGPYRPERCAGGGPSSAGAPEQSRRGVQLQQHGLRVAGHGGGAGDGPVVRRLATGQRIRATGHDGDGGP